MALPSMMHSLLREKRPLTQLKTRCFMMFDISSVLPMLIEMSDFGRGVSQNGALQRRQDMAGRLFGVL